MNETLLIGCGNLGYSVVEAFLKKKKKISIVEKNNRTLSLLEKKKSRLIAIHKNFKKINFKRYKYILICVKPIDLEILAKQLHFLVQNNNIIISFVAGLTTFSLKKKISPRLPLVRLMPNLSIKYGESVTAVYSVNLSDKERRNLNFFSFFDTLVWLKKEEEIDFFTAFFGGGPAYICYFLKCFQNILEKKKIKKEISLNLIIQLFNSTISFLENEKIGFNDLIKMVASKGGTTEKALEYFSQNKRLETVISTAIKKAEIRSKDISKNKN